MRRKVPRGGVMKFCQLDKRAIVEISGEDAYDFLQELVTIDVHKIEPDHAMWGGLLSPQGKYLFDFFCYHASEAIYIDIDKSRTEFFIEHLSKYVLRNKVSLKLREDLRIAAFWAPPKDDFGFDDEEDDDSYSAMKPMWFEKYQIVADPRSKNMGYRWVGTREKFDTLMQQYEEKTAPYETYKAHRIFEGIVDPIEDMAGIDFFWPEIGAEAMNGIDYYKGCYVGQEVTARLKHKTELKKRVVRVSVMGEPKIPSVMETDVKEIGTLLAYANGVGLAYVRIDRWQHSIETLRSITAGASIVYKAA